MKVRTSVRRRIAAAPRWLRVVTTVFLVLWAGEPFHQFLMWWRPPAGCERLSGCTDLSSRMMLTCYAIAAFGVSLLITLAARRLLGWDKPRQKS